MSKDIKDYIHLYLGCDVKTNERLTEAPRIVLSGIYYAEDRHGYRPDAARCQLFTHPGENILWVRLDELKLLLRRLSDMTKEEKLEYNQRKQRKGYMAQIIHADNTVWLLSKGFDLFGLIPAGLAIDKTQLPEKV